MVNTWKIILATVVIFGAGVITGGLLVNHTTRTKTKLQRASNPVLRPQQLTPPLREWPRRPASELQPNLEQRRMEFILNVTRELQLSPEQRQHIERVVRESQERTRKLWEQVGPQMRKELTEVREKIREELTPQQRKRFEELMKRQQTRRGDDLLPAGREKRDGRRPNSPPGPGGQEVGEPGLRPAPDELPDKP